MIGRERDKTNVLEHFKINSKLETDPVTIANVFCDHFTQVGQKLKQNIPQSRHNANHYMGRMAHQNFFMAPTDPMEIMHIINQLKSKSSSGHDGLPVTLIKDLNSALYLPICTLVNKSIAEGSVPDMLKQAKITPDKIRR